MRPTYGFAAILMLLTAPHALVSQEIKPAGVVGAVAGGLVGGLAWLVSH